MWWQVCSVEWSELGAGRSPETWGLRDRCSTVERRGIETPWLGGSWQQYLESPVLASLQLVGALEVFPLPKPQFPHL